MTVREVVNALPGAKKIGLNWSDHVIDLNKRNALMMDAYGDYKVQAIWAINSEEFEIDIAVQPIREAGI